MILIFKNHAIGQYFQTIFFKVKLTILTVGHLYMLEQGKAPRLDLQILTTVLADKKKKSH